MKVVHCSPPEANPVGERERERERESSQSSFTLSVADGVVGRPRGDLKEARHVLRPRLPSQVAQLPRAHWQAAQR